MEWLHRLINLIALILGVFWTILLCLVTLAAALISDHFGPFFMRLWGRGWLKLMGIRLKVLGLEQLPKHQAVVLAPNHESGYDIFVLAALPIRFMWVAKMEIGKIPFVGRTMAAIGCYFLRRDSSGYDLNVMKEVENGLRLGKSVAIFPEGTRTRTGELLPFKKGAFRTAQNAGAPLVPVGIHGTYSIAPPGKKLPPRWGHEVTVTIGQPLMISPKDDINEVIGKVREILLQLRRSAANTEKR